MISWNVIEEKLTGVRTERIGLEDIFKADWNPESYVIDVDVKGSSFNFDLNSFFSPILGNFWRVLYAENDAKGIQDALLCYYKYRSKPTIVADVFTLGDKDVTVRTKFVDDDDRTDNLVDVTKLISDINASFPYNRTVIGSNGRVVEMQFLDSSNRIDANKDDFIDPGLFVSLNGQLKVSAGLSRLKCTNGLVEKFNVYEGTDFKFGKEFLERSIKLVKWLVDRQKDKVTSLKELLVVTHCLPKQIIDKNWKAWTIKQETGELTWYDVIADITSYANRYVDNTRHRLLEFPEVYNKYTKDGSCPVCATELK